MVKKREVFCPAIPSYSRMMHYNCDGSGRDSYVM